MSLVGEFYIVGGLLTKLFFLFLDTVVDNSLGRGRLGDWVRIEGFEIKWTVGRRKRIEIARKLIIG